MRTARWLVAAVTLTLSSTSFAQSDANRAAARALAEDGIGLQQQGKFAEALDKLQRAQSLVDAPTHLLHIAECQAALGKVVEASETYRKLARTNLADNAPAAFKKAQEAGAAELSALEPKIPWLEIDVKPANVAGLSVTLDGTPVPPALIGVERPANPGAHEIEASAPGYAPATAKVTLASAAHEKVSLALRAGGGAIAAVPPGGPTPAAGPPSGQMPPPSVDSGGAMASGSASSGSKLGFLVAGRFAFVSPSGKTGAGDGGTSEDVTRYFKSGAGLELDAGIRFARHFAVFGLFGYDALDKGSAAADFAQPGVTVDAKSSHRTIGVGGQYASTQSTSEGIGIFGELDLVSSKYTAEFEQSAAGASCTDEFTASGAAARLGGGVHVPLGRAFLLSPFLLAEVGQFDELGASQSGSGCKPLSASVSTTTKDTHTTLFLGVGGAWVSDHD